MTLALQNLDLTQTTEIAFSNTNSGQILAEVFIQPQHVDQGNGATAPQIIVSGLEIRLDDNDNVEIHNLYKDGIAHNTYVQYLNYQQFDDGSYQYDGVRALIYEQANLSPNDEDAKWTYDFPSLRDLLIYMKDNFKVNTIGAKPMTHVGTSSRIKDPLDALFGRKS